MANKNESFKITAKSFIMRIGNNTGTLPDGCGFVAKGKLFALAKFTDSVMSENPISDNKNGLYRLYSSITFQVLYNGNEIIALNPMVLYPGAIDTDVGKEKLGPISFTPPNLKVDLLNLSRRDAKTFVFGWRALGRPNLGAEPAMQSVCIRSSRYIWHRVFGEIKLINGKISIRARVSGSEFPSHRAYVNGKTTGFVPQGPFSNLWVASSFDSSMVNETSVLAEILNEIN